MLQVHGAGLTSVIQAGDVEHWNRGLDRWLTVGSEERAPRRVLPADQVHVKGALDVGGLPTHIQNHAIRMLGGDLKTLRHKEIGQLLVVLFRRAETLGKLFRRQILVEKGACWVDKLG